MDIKIYLQNGILFAKLTGELDHHSSEDVRQAVDASFERSNCKYVVFDFSGVTFMDSSGIGVIIGRYKNAEKRGGQLAVTGMNGVMQRIFKISGLEKIVKSYITADEAEKAMGGGIRERA